MSHFRKKKIMTELTKLRKVEDTTTSLTFVPNGIQFSQKKPFCVGRDNKGKMLLLQVAKQHIETIKSTEYTGAIKAKHIEVVRVAQHDQKSSYLVTAQTKEGSIIKGVEVDELPPLNVLATTTYLKPKKAMMIQYLHVVQRGVCRCVPVWKKKTSNGQEQVYSHYGADSFALKIPITLYANVRFVNSNKFAIGEPVQRGRNFVLTNMELKFHEPANASGMWVIWSTALTDIIACDDEKVLTPALLRTFETKRRDVTDCDNSDSSNSDGDATPAKRKQVTKRRKPTKDSDSEPDDDATRAKPKATKHVKSAKASDTDSADSDDDATHAKPKATKDVKSAKASDTRAKPKANKDVKSSKPSETDSADNGDDTDSADNAKAPKSTKMAPKPAKAAKAAAPKLPKVDEDSDSVTQKKKNQG